MGTKRLFLLASVIDSSWLSVSHPSACWKVHCFYRVAQCFAFLICTKWYNPAIHRHSHIRTPSSSSTSAGYSNRGSGLLVSPDEEFEQSGICSLQDIGGHIMKVLLVGFQIMLFMRLAVHPLKQIFCIWFFMIFLELITITFLFQETPPSARYIPIPVLFAPLFLLQGVAVVFAIFRFLEKIASLLYTEGGNRNYFRVPPIIHGSLGFMHRGSR